MTTFTDTIPHLNIEVLSNGLIRLENESMGDSYVVDVHPLQIRHIAEKAGLVKACDRDAQHTIAALLSDSDRYKRALLAIKERAEQLYENIYKSSQRGHEDLGIEVAQSAALSDFAEFVCIEFEDDFTTTNQHTETGDEVTSPPPAKEAKPRGETVSPLGAKKLKATSPLFDLA